MHLSSSMSMAESNIRSSSKLGLHGCQPTEQEKRPPSPPPVWSSMAAIRQTHCRRCLLTASPGRPQVPTSPTTCLMFGQQAVVQLGTLLLLHEEPSKIMVFSHSLLNNIYTVGMWEKILYCLEKACKISRHLTWHLNWRHVDPVLWRHAKLPAVVWSIVWGISHGTWMRINGVNLYLHVAWFKSQKGAAGWPVQAWADSVMGFDAEIH